MHRFLTILPFLLLGAAAPAFAEESLLERLSAETRKLAEAVRAASVEVRVPYRVRVRFTHSAVEKPGGRSLVPGTYKGSRAGRGVLVGTPPVVVVPQALAGDASKVTVTLPDGKQRGAERWGGDKELGIAVYGFPKDVAARWTGLEPERDWDRLVPGTLALRAGGALELGLVQDANRVLGWIRGEEAGPGAALVGAGGKLLGIRGGPARVTGRASGRAIGGHPVSSTPSHQWMRRDGRTVRWRAPGIPVATSVPVGVAARGLYIAGPVIARVVDDVREHGRVRHGFLGVVLGETAGKEGVTITAVLDDSPAQRAGLTKGLEVVSVDGVACASSAGLSRALALRAPGETLTLRVRRGDDARDVTVELGDLAEARRDLVSEASFGLTCVDLTDGLRAFFGVDAGADGVLVQAVDPQSAAHRAGLRRGDLVYRGGDGTIANLEELRAALAGAKGTVSLTWLRDGHRTEGTLKLPRVKRTTR